MWLKHTPVGVYNHWVDPKTLTAPAHRGSPRTFDFVYNLDVAVYDPKAEVCRSCTKWVDLHRLSVALGDLLGESVSEAVEGASPLNPPEPGSS